MSIDRNAQLVRVLGILRDLDRLGGVDVYELAERYGATVRTIRRDLAALREVGLPVRPERAGKRNRWRIAYRDHRGKLAGLLDASHYLALKVAMSQGGPVRGAASLFATLEDLASKIERAIGPAGRARLEAIESCFHSYEKFAWRRPLPDVFWPLVEAITDHLACSVVYRAVRRTPRAKAFDVLPLRLFAHQGAVYLMCVFLEHDNLGTLNLHRLESLRVLDRRVEPPADFDPARFENAAFGVYTGTEETTYVLRFRANVAEYVRERVWHPSQRLRELRGGGVELAFTCGRSPEVEAWVASWGRDVQVVAPAELREHLGDLGAWLSRTYAER